VSRMGDFVEECECQKPHVFVVLGSGMGPLMRAVRPIAQLAFTDIPGVPSSSVAGHRGVLTLGRWTDRVVIVSEGRLHYYEGHPWEGVAQPIQIAAGLGVKIAILTNAAGGIRGDLNPGSLLPIRDHIEWNRPYPWREPPRPSPYSKRLLDLLAQVGGTSAPGVYASVTGPNYETPAEIRALRSCGGDAVGMSTTREAIAGMEAGLEIAAISLITNRAAGQSKAPIDHDEVIAVGAAAAERFAGVIEGVLARLD
jgi:purine-nucleoside phosphorylase